MKISFGLGKVFTPRRWRWLKRGSFLGGIILGGFTFFQVDLVRSDAHFSTNAHLSQLGETPVIEIELNNQTDVPMENLTASFLLLLEDGALNLVDGNDDGTYDSSDIPDQRFSPENMAIAPKSSKVAFLYDDEIEHGVGEVQYIGVCAIFDGSFWIDRVKVSYIIERMRNDSFGQAAYRKEVYFFTRPKCDLPGFLEQHKGKSERLQIGRMSHVAQGRRQIPRSV